MMMEQNTASVGERGACCGRGGEGGSGRRHRHRDHCCGGRNSREVTSNGNEAEIGMLERQIATSRARLAELRRQ
jgi:hypothetical protein